MSLIKVRNRPRKERLPELEAWKFRALLDGEDLLPIMMEEIASIKNKKKRASAAARFEYALSFKRTDPLVELMIKRTTLTDDQMDTLWAEAGAL